MTDQPIIALDEVNSKAITNWRFGFVNQPPYSPRMRARR